MIIDNPWLSVKTTPTCRRKREDCRSLPEGAAREMRFANVLT